MASGWGYSVASRFMSLSFLSDRSGLPVAIGLAPCRCGECSPPSSTGASSPPTVPRSYALCDGGASLAVSRHRPNRYTRSDRAASAFPIAQRRSDPIAMRPESLHALRGQCHEEKRSPHHQLHMEGRLWKSDRRRMECPHLVAAPTPKSTKSPAAVPIHPPPHGRASRSRRHSRTIRPRPSPAPRSRRAARSSTACRNRRHR